MRSKRGLAAMCTTAAIAVVACGGGAKPETAPAAYPQQQPSPGGAAPSSMMPSAEAPSSAERAPAEQGAPARSTPTPAPAPAPVAPSAPPPRGDGESRQAAMRRAFADVEAAQRELDVAAGDCATACRALGSMERAAGHLCDLASDVEDRRRCEDAKTRVQASRDRVRTTCGSCPGGPSVERTAPIPSR